MSEQLSSRLRTEPSNRFRYPHTALLGILALLCFVAGFLSTTPFWVLCVGCSLLIALGSFWDWEDNQSYRVGITRSGCAVVERGEFNRRVGGKGVRFCVSGRGVWWDRWLPREWRRGVIGLLHEVERTRITVEGDADTGQCELLAEWLDDIEQRGETAIIYSPEPEHLETFYNAERGDLILNVFDQRCPYWRPGRELASNWDALTLAGALFAELEKSSTTLAGLARQILAHLFLYDPTPEGLAAWLSSEREIDTRLRGTAVGATWSKATRAERAELLTALAAAGEAFGQLPRREESAGEWSARQWAEERKGWIFLTPYGRTRNVQRRLLSMWLDSILTHLMEGLSDRPVWLMIEGLAGLDRLPALESIVRRNTQCNVRLVLVYEQGREIEELYGREAATTMLDRPTARVCFRRRNAEQAKEVSRMLGERVVAREKVGQTPPGEGGAKRYVEERTENAVSGKDLQTLSQGSGYIQINDCIACFDLPPTQRPSKAAPFKPRESARFVPRVLPTPADPPRVPRAAPAVPAAKTGHGKPVLGLSSPAVPPASTTSAEPSRVAPVATEATVAKASRRNPILGLSTPAAPPPSRPSRKTAPRWRTRAPRPAADLAGGTVARADSDADPSSAAAKQPPEDPAPRPSSASPPG